MLHQDQDGYDNDCPEGYEEYGDQYYQDEEQGKHSSQGGRGHWAGYYTSPQSFTPTTTCPLVT